METRVDKKLVTQLVSDQASQKSVLGLVETQRRAWSIGQAFWKMVMRTSGVGQRRFDLKASHRTKLMVGFLGRVIKSFLMS